ncbi:MAG: hypothetical protein ORN24_05055 [Burkholderiales bacterium]|nr:hypothetical protein [Burkholderiales bacterium]
MLYLIGYILCGVLSLISTYFASNEYSLSIVMFTTVAITATFYSILTIMQTKYIYATLLKHKTIYFSLLFLTALIWWLTFVINKVVSPTFLELIFGYTAPIIAVFIEWRKRKQILHRNVFLALLVVGGLICNFLLQHYSFLYSCIIILYVITFGTAFFLFSHISSTMNKKFNLSVLAILAVRYWLLLIVLMVYIFANHPDYVRPLTSFVFYGKMIYIAVFLFIIPVYLYQKAIEKLGANKSLIMLSFSPILMFIGEMVYKTYSPTDLRLLIAAIAMFIITVCYKLAESKNAKENLNS